MPPQDRDRDKTNTLTNASSGYARPFGSGHVVGDADTEAPATAAAPSAGEAAMSLTDTVTSGG